MSIRYDYVMDQLKRNLETEGIPNNINNKVWTERILDLAEEINGNIEKPTKDFIEFTKEFMQLQDELEQTKKYHLKTYNEARVLVYDNPEVMDNRYLNGLLLSQALWINHSKFISWFRFYFCNVGMNGKVLEVPLGTGIYISIFKNFNPSWSSIGYDISLSACEYTRKLVKIQNYREITITKKDVFELEERNIDRIICGELLEHMENPRKLLKKLKSMLSKKGKIFLTTCAWTANIDHIYLFKSVQEIRDMLTEEFEIERELVLPVIQGDNPEGRCIPIDYACILRLKE
jgi:SAM-dependent methyltransferase